LAAALRKQPGIGVEVIDGDHGELTVSVNGRVVARKGDSLPDVQEVVNAVSKAAPAGANA